MLKSWLRERARAGSVTPAGSLVDAAQLRLFTDSKNQIESSLKGFVLAKAKMARPVLMQALAGKAMKSPPVWLMRQAGRYLAEYRELRAKARDFLAFCHTPELAVEATLQPVRRFGFDAAILFSDILVVPDALGRKVRFVEGDGPLLDPIGAGDIARLDIERYADKLAPVFATVRQVRQVLPAEKALIGFCGAPWTVATYMIAGRGSGDQAQARLFAYENREAMELLMDKLVGVSADYLARQIDAGADAVQIFDSWAGILPQSEFEAWCVKPVARIVEALRKRRPDAKIIGFPRGAGSNYRGYAKKTGVDAVGLDWTVGAAFGRSLQKASPVQGNLDPLALLAGGDALDRSVDTVLATYGGGAHIFNLGHGILPETPIAHVERMLKRLGR